MDNMYTAGIDKFINDNRENIIRDIARLVAIDSVEGKAEPGAPFGKGPKQALELGLEICRELGLEAVNCEDKIGYGQIGDAEDYLATITHLDVVPVGEGWTGDPFTLREREGYIIGRGVMDDKGPSVLCLYALKYLKDAGVPLRYSIRALLGTNEETGMGDVEYYLDNYKAPVFCFSPDSGFPVCNGEKGICNLRIVSKTKLDKIADIRGGVAGNVIPGKAEAWVKGAKPAATESVSVEADGELWHLTAKGIGGHASKPEGTVNAIGVLISYILENKLAGEEEEKFLRLLMKLHESWDGSGLGVDADDGKFEPLTIIGGVIGVEDGHIFQTVDSRYPTNTSGRKIADTISALAGGLAEIELKRDTAPFYMSIDNSAVKVCMDVYLSLIHISEPTRP